MHRLVLGNIPISGLDSMQTRLYRPRLVRLSRVLVCMNATQDHSLTNKKMQACFKHHLLMSSTYKRTTSLEFVLGFRELGPTHARSVFGGVRSGSKNRVRCSIN